MSSQPPKSIDGNWLRLEPGHPAEEEGAKASLAQLSWLAILFSVTFLLLPFVFKGWAPPPWHWPQWGKIAGLIGVCLCGWIGIDSVMTLNKRRFNNWRLGLGPYDVWLMQGSEPHQPLRLRIHQQIRSPVRVERLDVSLVYVETTLTVGVEEHNYNQFSIRDRELWSNPKTIAFENQSFPTDSILEASTDFANPDVAELHRRTDEEVPKKPVSGVESTRGCHWRVRIETYLTDGRATNAVFSLTSAQAAGLAHEQLAETRETVPPAGLAQELAETRESAPQARLVQELAEARETVPQASPQLADLLARFGHQLLKVNASAEAEPVLRECLAIRERWQPHVWSTFNTKSVLGGALLGQKNYAEAEPLLIAGYEGMKDREATIPPEGKIRLTEALLRLIDFYTASGDAEKVDEWRAKLSRFLDWLE